MELNKINSLVELFFKKYKEISSPEKKFFLQWLKNDKEKFLTWAQVQRDIVILSEELIKILNNGDRCLLLSENRPEWLIADIAIMNAGGVTVPLFTTYSQDDYEYIIKDCNPKICIVSNKSQYEKIKKFISNEIIILSIENFSERILNFQNISGKYKKTVNSFEDYNQKIHKLF